jgi:hypothetical protein
MAEGERFDLKAGISGTRQRVEVAVVDRAGLLERRSWEIAVEAPLLPPLAIRAANPKVAPGQELVLTEGQNQTFSIEVKGGNRAALQYVWQLDGKKQATGSRWTYEALASASRTKECGSSYPAARALPWSTSGGSGSIRPTALRRSSLHTRRAAACGASESSCECRGQGLALLSAPRMQRGLRTSARSGGAEAVSKDQALDEGREGGFRGCRCYTGPTFAAHTNPKTPPLSGVLVTGGAVLPGPRGRALARLQPRATSPAPGSPPSIARRAHCATPIHPKRRHGASAMPARRRIDTGYTPGAGLPRCVQFPINSYPIPIP